MGGTGVVGGLTGGVMVGGLIGVVGNDGGLYDGDGGLIAGDVGDVGKETNALDSSFEAAKTTLVKT